MLPKLEGVNQVDTLDGLVHVRACKEPPITVFFILAAARPDELEIESYVRMKALSKDLQHQIRCYRDTLLNP